MGAKVWCGQRDEFGGDAISFAADGTVAAIGRRRELEANLSSPDAVREVEGVLVPGFIDAHTHVRAAAAARLAVDCSACHDPESLLAAVAAAVPDEGRDGGWITLVGLESANLQRLPTLAELDAVCPLNPVRIRHRSMHGWLLNGFAAGRLSAVLDSDRPEGLVEDHDGRIRRAMGRVSPPESLEDAVSEWSQERLEQGVVGILDTTANNGPEEILALVDWRRDGFLQQDLRVLTGDPRCEAGAPVVGVKLMPDESRVEAMELRRQIENAWKTHDLVAIHCVELGTLGAIIEAVEGIPSSARRRLRVEHASLCPPDWLPRVAALGLSVVTHPAFVSAHADRYRREVPSAMHDWLYRLGSWLDHGVELGVGSDEPAGPGDPRLGWAAARTRRGDDGELLGPGERLSAGAAFTAMGETAARVSGFPDLGRLRPGSAGSAVLLRGDPFDGPVERLEVEAVVSAGRFLAASDARL